VGDPVDRLPRTALPSRYDLAIEPDLERATFRGTVEVALEVLEPVGEIVLNAKELELDTPRLTRADGAGVEVTKVREDPEAERVYLELAREVEPGGWVLRIDFRGRLNDRLAGFYRSTYVGPDGRRHVIAATQFQATDARRAFPCWDEPDRKAVVAMTLIVPDGVVALANEAEIERERRSDGRVRIRFADTIPISTYLVAFVVGPLVMTEPIDVDGVPMRAACVPGREHLTGYALDVGAHALRFFADYYGVAYPGGKLDHVAIPDFAPGAMENLGCITYRETLMLLDPATATHGERLDVAETVAHEVAHMWFGDLVTMRWWNGIWLNEAFATFMSYLAVDAWRPAWRVWTTFTRLRAGALDVDSLDATRPIEYPVRTPDDASGMFDTLTYTKGAAVLRMLERWLGPTRFRNGIRRYLRTHAYGSTETHDLWDALEAETGAPVRRVADAWIFRPGYPAVIATSEDGHVRLTQVRFTQTGFRRLDPADRTTWPVPLLLRRPSGDAAPEPVLLEADGLRVPVGEDEPLVVNADGASFVRVLYDDAMLRRLGGVRARLTPAERHDLVDDVWAAAVAGASEVGAFLDLVDGFREEEELVVWQAILEGLSWCDRFVEGPAREALRASVRALVGPAADRLGREPKDGEDDLVRALRGELVRALGLLGADPQTRGWARELELAARRGDEVDPQLAAAAVDIVAAWGVPEDYEDFRRRVPKASTPQEAWRYLLALPRFPQEELLDRTLEATLSEEVRSQDAPFVIARALAHRELGPRAWAFLRDRWEAVVDRVAASNLISAVAGVRYLTDPATVADVQAFFESHDVPQHRLVLRQILERQRVLAAFRERATPELAARLGSGPGPGT
jgi:puromycin-sensitive aminopeptidase